MHKYEKLSEIRRKPRRRKIRTQAVVVLILVLICIGTVCAYLFVQSDLRAKPTDIPAKKTSQSSALSSKAIKTSSVNASENSSSSTTETTQASQISIQDAAKPLWINVSIASQDVIVYDANNRVVENFICSTGSPGYNTPTGTFTVQDRGKSFFSQKYQEGGYYWVAFYEDYYFHSVPFDKNGNIIPSIAKALGTEDSHGCVHLSIANAKWIYDNIPRGTKVVIE